MRAVGIDFCRFRLRLNSELCSFCIGNEVGGTDGVALSRRDIIVQNTCFMLLSFLVDIITTTIKPLSRCHLRLICPKLDGCVFIYGFSKESIIFYFSTYIVNIHILFLLYITFDFNVVSCPSLSIPTANGISQSSHIHIM
ncbi:hypothetical protein XELAEV_18036103mg [Xenopus laevis]|uniref:Uncharacterized protein n=1 Tax=Xenopus laevis TaxID=8355 RepID=A0A974CGT8_XENLA|nr:hypothetical protein XELAEV_18036103mg [Xenopus laevis]